MMKERLVIIPTYNERENIDAMIHAVMQLEPAFDLLVVDDGSPDGTAGVVKALAAEWPNRIFLLERRGKLGLGTAYIAGFKWALKEKYSYIFEMDCDFSHPVDSLPTLFHALSYDGYDVAIGSRYTKGGGIKGWPWSRLMMSYFASIYVRMVTWLPVKDTTAGFVGYRRDTLEHIDLEAIHFKGYAFQIEMKWVAYCLGYRIVEVPITFIDRQKGASKMDSSIFGEAFWGVFKLKWWKITGKYPAKRK